MRRALIIASALAALALVTPAVGAVDHAPRVLRVGTWHGIGGQFPKFP